MIYPPPPSCVSSHFLFQNMYLNSSFIFTQKNQEANSKSILKKDGYSFNFNMKMRFSFGLVLINRYSKLQLLVFICQNGYPSNIGRDMVKPIWGKYSLDENQNLTHTQVYVSF